MEKILPAAEIPVIAASAPKARGDMGMVGKGVLRFMRTLLELGAFSLITLGVTLTKWNTAKAVIRPLIRTQIARAGLGLLPMVTFLAFALGLVVIGQMVLLLNRFGAQNFAGTVMVTVVVRELGPLLAALLVLARAGTANVIELGTARAMGEVEALEALGIDPIHYLVMPRVIGMALSIFALTVYLILFALLSGYLVAFVGDVPLLPGQYFRQVAAALLWQDFVLLALKTLCFGILIALVTSFEGLAQPLHLGEVGSATTRAVGKCVIGAVLLDAVFLLAYLII
jgi:phospholipid/cholesterol/gamma-HCH transport system permease protein